MSVPSEAEITDAKREIYHHPVWSAETFYRHLLHLESPYVSYAINYDRIDREFRDYNAPDDLDEFLINDPGVDPRFVLRYRIIDDPYVKAILERIPEVERQEWHDYCVRVNYGHLRARKRTFERTVEEILRDLSIKPDTAEALEKKREFPDEWQELRHIAEGDINRLKNFLVKALTPRQNNKWWTFGNLLEAIAELSGTGLLDVFESLQNSENQRDRDLIRLSLKTGFYRDYVSFDNLVSQLPEDEQQLWEHYDDSR